MTTDEELDWSLVEFATQAAEMPKSSAEGRFDFLKPELISKEDEQSTPPENAGDTPSEIPQLINEEPVALLSERAAHAGKSDIDQKNNLVRPFDYFLALFCSGDIHRHIYSLSGLGGRQFDNLLITGAGDFKCLPAVPDLTCCADIKLNKRVSL